jgi:hypothetical protein
MVTVLSLLANYWWAAGLVVLFLAYVLLRKFAKSKAKLAIEGYLRGVEKSVFAAGDVSTSGIANKIYVALPLRIRLFVPRAIFDVIVAEAYHAAKRLVEKTQANADVATTVPAK